MSFISRGRPWPLRLFVLLLALTTLSRLSNATVFINEVMYSPRWNSGWFEFIELYNDASTPFDLSGHAIQGLPSSSWRRHLSISFL